MVENPSLHIRPMLPQERPTVRRIAWRAFPVTSQPFFSWSPHVLVAETASGRLVGGAVLKLFGLPNRGASQAADSAPRRKGGLVSWIFVDPDAQGLGAGQALAEGAIAFFQEQGCDEMFAGVEGHNTSSSKLFSTRGFSILSPGALWSRYGLLGMLSVWIHTFHCIDIGHFLWSRPAPASPDNPIAQWWGTVLANVLLGYLVLGRISGFRLRAAWWLAIPLAILVLLGARFAAMSWAARRQGLTVRFRAWESGFPMGVALALLAGTFYPSPGSLYPDRREWRYRELLPKLGPMALAGAGAVLAVTLMASLGASPGAPDGLATWLLPARVLGKWFLLFEVLLSFFPFASFNGRRIWDWNRFAWVALAVPTLAITFLL